MWEIRVIRSINSPCRWRTAAHRSIRSCRALKDAIRTGLALIVKTSSSSSATVRRRIQRPAQRLARYRPSLRRTIGRRSPIGSLPLPLVPRCTRCLRNKEAGLARSTSSLSRLRSRETPSGSAPLPRVSSDLCVLGRNRSQRLRAGAGSATNMGSIMTAGYARLMRALAMSGKSDRFSIKQSGPAIPLGSMAMWARLHSRTRGPARRR